MASPIKNGLYGSSVGDNMLRAATAECIGTFLLVFAGTAVATAASVGRVIAGGGLDSLSVAAAFGLALVALVSALGQTSGAHLNPAVTLALAATKKFSLRYVPAYAIAQIIGAVLASLAVWAVFGDAGRNVAPRGATTPAATASVLQALLAETLITFFLVFVIISVATDPRAPRQATGLAVGFTLAAAVRIGGPVTGGAVNPARAIGPMLVSGTFTAGWVYLIGPVIGGVVAAVLYERFLKKAGVPTAD